jgi:hypothetical protein
MTLKLICELRGTEVKQEHGWAGANMLTSGGPVRGTSKILRGAVRFIID